MSTPATESPETAAVPAEGGQGRGGSVAPRRVGGPRHWWDWVLAADPGLGQLQSGWRSLVSMVTALAVGYGMSVALSLPAMLGMMVGGMMGLMSAFAVAENTPKRLARAILWMPFPYSAVLPLAAWLHQDRALEITLMVVALAVTFFLARFGALALLTGMMLFNAFMVGMMADIPLNLCGKLFVVAVVSAAAVLAARLLLCCPMPREDLLRTQRAFVIESRRVADAAISALDPDADHEVAVRRMRKSLRRLNVTTVTIDGRLGQPEVAADPDTAELLHQRLFDAELALQGIGQSVQRLTRLQVTAELREAIVVGLVIARDTPLGRSDALRLAGQLVQQQATAVLERPGIDSDEAEAAALARRVGNLIDSLASALTDWLDLGWNSPTERAKVPFQPVIALEQNRPAGTGAVARRVSAAQDVQGWQRAIPYLRAPLHAGVAAAIVCPITDAIDPQRFYWGLVGVMITLFGTNTTHERLRKLAHRMAGTVVGAVIGIALLRLIGPGHIYWTLTVIVAGLSIGAWGIQRQYAYWVVGLVTALVQLYGMSTPYDGMDHLLAERLLDNGLGILIAIACAALIFPVSSRKITQEAERGYVSAVEHLISQTVLRWREPEAPVRLRGAARGVDAALFQIRGVARPLVRMPMGVRGRSPDNRVALLSTATGHARAFAAAADMDIDLPAAIRDRVERITELFAESLQVLDRHFATGEAGGTWVRVGPYIHDLEAALRGPGGPRAERLQRALQELAALDEALAGYAEARSLATTTQVPAPGSSPAATRLGGESDGGAGRSPSLDRRTTAALAAWAAHSRRAGDTRGTGTSRLAPAAAPERVAPLPARRTESPRGAATAIGTAGSSVTVVGSLSCADHPGGCDAWITVVSDRGKRQPGVRAVRGRYRVTGLRPGGYTVVASGAAHAPRAEFLSLSPSDSGRELRFDIELEPASKP
ncbi:FUSC family protein [Streptomyces tsukubensis]|uniref:FUSC family protein n=1 Tax=Streptomyces tsukubensis TaxID=83656 RepID=A0A1V4AF40_9ACTN|nr:FUSC family protein [Streptomyces tsukubensis]OON82694.1 FUSC family protein [Streptomyces tsukubensis]QFR92133.1 FUSC family protein [Streptomyces tsukubensis]